MRSPPGIKSESLYDALAGLQRESLWEESRDILFMHCEPVWIDFAGVPSSRGRPVPFVDAFPLSMWVHLQPRAKSKRKECDGSLDENHGPNVVDVNNRLNQEKSDRPDAFVSERYGGSDNEASLHVLLHTPGLVSAQIHHYQYLFLLRQLDMVTELATFLTHDTETIVANSKRKIDDSLVVSTNLFLYLLVFFNSFKSNRKEIF